MLFYILHILYGLLQWCIACLHMCRARPCLQVRQRGHCLVLKRGVSHAGQLTGLLAEVLQQGEAKGIISAGQRSALLSELAAHLDPPL